MHNTLSHYLFSFKRASLSPRRLISEHFCLSRPGQVVLSELEKAMFTSHGRKWQCSCWGWICNLLYAIYNIISIKEKTNRFVKEKNAVLCKSLFWFIVTVMKYFPSILLLLLYMVVCILLSHDVTTFVIDQ